MHNPVFSVVIPAYNAVGLILNALESVKNQTCGDFEIVVVDNGSTDGTYELAASYLAMHSLPGRCVRHEDRRGKVAGARNRGIKEARGKYIALLDHDDTWCPAKLEVVLREFSADPEVCVVCSRARMITDKGDVLGLLNTGSAPENVYETLLLKRNLLAASFTVFSRDCAIEAGGFRENPEYNTVEDYDLWIRLSKKHKFRFTREVLGDYLVRRDSSSAAVSNHYNNLRDMLAGHLTEYFGPNPSLAGRARMKLRMASLYRVKLARQLMNLSVSGRFFRVIFKLARKI